MVQWAGLAGADGPVGGTGRGTQGWYANVRIM